MAYKYVPWVTGVDGLKPNTKCVLYVLTECAFIARDDNGNELGYGIVKLSRATLAEKCGWKRGSVKSLDRELDALEARKLIRKRRNKNPDTNHRAPSDILVMWQPWGKRAAEDGLAEDDDESAPEDDASATPAPMVTSTPHGQTTTGVDNRPLWSNDHSPYGQTTIAPYGQTTTKEQGSPNRDPNKEQPRPDDGGAGDGFNEWVSLFPEHKRRNIDRTRALYTQVLNRPDMTHQRLTEATRTYIEHEKAREGGKYIRQAEKFLDGGNSAEYRAHMLPDVKLDGWPDTPDTFIGSKRPKKPLPEHLRYA